MNRRELFGQLATLAASSRIPCTPIDEEFIAILNNKFAALDLSMATLKADWNDFKSATSKKLDSIRCELGANSTALASIRGQLTKLEIAQAIMFIWLTVLTVLTGLDFVTPNIGLL